MRAFVCIYAYYEATMLDMTALAQDPLLTAATAFLLLFAGVAALDGVYLHLWRFRLHARAESYAEHLWHTASAVLFVPLVAALFVADARGEVLWLGLAMLVATHAVEVFDVRAERSSRRGLGGLSRAELAVHIAAVVTRTTAIGLLLASRPAEAWSLDAGPAIGLPSEALALASAAVFWGAVVVALLHVGLAVLHCPSCVGLRGRSSGASGA
jgi:hypothetical protein